VLTSRITGCGGKIDHIKNRGHRIPVHAVVNTRGAFCPLCDFAVRPRHAGLPRLGLPCRTAGGNREALGHAGTQQNLRQKTVHTAHTNSLKATSHGSHCDSSVIQQSDHQTLSHTHANPTRGKHSATRLTIRRVHAMLKSAIRSSPSSRAASVLTSRISGRRELSNHLKNVSTAAPLHAMVTPLCPEQMLIHWFPLEIGFPV
jgi:hypothetical protein